MTALGRSNIPEISRTPVKTSNNCPVKGVYLLPTPLFPRQGRRQRVGQWCPAPPFEIGAPHFTFGPRLLHSLHPIQYFKNVAPLLVFGLSVYFLPPLLLNPGDGPVPRLLPVSALNDEHSLRVLYCLACPLKSYRSECFKFMTSCSDPTDMGVRRGGGQNGHLPPPGKWDWEPKDSRKPEVSS